MSQSGGALKGQGTYGCVFAPAPTYIDRKDLKGLEAKIKKIVVKICRDERTAREEWEYAKIIVTIDPKQDYFLYPIAQCRVRNSALLRDGEAYNCDFINPNNTSKDHPALIMPYGGLTIYEYGRSDVVSMSDAQFARAMLPVLRGIERLNRAGFVHQDIKFDNIMYNQATGECRLIDFGLMVPLMDVFDLTVNEFLMHNYWLHPPEYRALMLLHAYGGRPWPRPLPEEAAQELYKINDRILTSIDFRKDQSLKQIINNFIAPCKYERDFIDGWLALVTRKKTYEEAVHFTQKHAAKRVDVYCIGMTCAFMLHYLSNTNDAVRAHLHATIARMIHPNPRDRMSITQARRQFEAIALSDAQQQRQRSPRSAKLHQAVKGRPKAPRK